MRGPCRHESFKAELCLPSNSTVTDGYRRNHVQLGASHSDTEGRVVRRYQTWPRVGVWLKQPLPRASCVSVM